MNRRGGYTGGKPAAEMGPPAQVPSETIRPDWTQGHSYTDLTRRTLIVDGVVYSAAEVRRIVHERHQQALEITRLRATLKRADRHLKLRTAALIRLIAAERPAAVGSGACGAPTCCSSRASRCSGGRSKAPAGSG